MNHHPNNSGPSHAHSWHNLRFANNGQPRGQSMMNLNHRTSTGGSSAAVANAFVSAEGSWSSQQGNSSWDPVPIGGRGLSNLLQNNPLFAGMEGAMNRSSAANGMNNLNNNHHHNSTTTAPSQSQSAAAAALNNHSNSDSLQQQQANKRQKTVSFATLSGAQAKSLQAPPPMQGHNGNSLFPTQQLQQQLQRQQQQRTLAHAAQSTPNLGTSNNNTNPFLNQLQAGRGGSMQNASFQNSNPSTRPNPFLAQLQGNNNMRSQSQSMSSANLSTTASNHDGSSTMNNRPQGHQFASIFDEAKPSPLAQMRQQQAHQSSSTTTALLEPSRKRAAPSTSSFKYGYASTFAKESASNPKLMFASMDGSSLLHNSCKLCKFLLLI